MQTQDRREPVFFTGLIGKHHRIINDMTDVGVRTASRLTAGLLCAALAWALAIAVPCTAAPLLKDSAFARAPNCDLEPFADLDSGRGERLLERDCGPEHRDTRLDVPRVQLVATGVPRVDVEQTVSTRWDSLIASARLGWSGASDEKQTRMSTQRALIAAGGLLKLDEDWALEMKVGRDAGPGLRTRATMAGLWRPVGEHLLFLQFAAEEGGVAQAVGLRYWLLPGRASFDLLARRSPDGQSIEPRFGFQLYNFGR